MPLPDEDDFIDQDKTALTFEPADASAYAIPTVSGGARKYLPGDVVDHVFQLTKLLGRGGMGVVFSCKHTGLNKTYALKLLSGENLSAESWKRFQAEAKVLARLNHEGIVSIHNMGIDDGQNPYFVMELLQGTGMDVYLQRNGPMSLEVALDCFILLADALSSAHQQGIVHRDVKPANIMVSNDESHHRLAIKLMDFGIARLSKDAGLMQTKTATGAVFGTPYYMSPEQTLGQKLDERSDIYSFGCTLYEALTGRPPFVGGNAFQTFLMHQNDAPPKISDHVRKEKIIPGDLEVVMQKALSKNLQHRYQTMKQLQYDLERVKKGKPVQSAAMTSGPKMDSANAGAIFSDSTTGSAALTGDFTARATGGSSRGTVDTKKKSKKASSSRVDSLALILLPVTLLLIVGLAVSYFLGLLPVSPWPRQKIEATKTSREFAITDRVDDKKKPKRLETPVEDEEAAKDDDKEDLGSIVPDPSTMPQGMVETLQKNLSVFQDKELKAIGASEEEIDRANRYNWTGLTVSEEQYKKRLDRFLKDLQTSNNPHVIRYGDKGYGLYLPEDVYLCAIKIGTGEFALAKGYIKLQKGEPLEIAFPHAMENNMRILTYFQPEDLTGLHISTKHLTDLFVSIQSWRKLNTLSLFNPLTKAFPKFQSWDQTKLFPQELKNIDGFYTVRDLGLCGETLSGQDILSMRSLARLDSIRLKSIADIDPLLKNLSMRSNIKQVWLINENLEDSQLEWLTKMPNLESVRIRRSRLTPHSVKYFKRMKKLKQLWLDRPWTNAEKKQFVRQIPCCQFESVIDDKFWQHLPK